MKKILNIFNYSLLFTAPGGATNQQIQAFAVLMVKDRQRKLTMHSWAYLQKEMNTLYPKPVCEPCKPLEVQSSHQQNQ